MRLSRRLKWGQAVDLLTLTQTAYDTIVEDLERMIERTVNPDRADYAVLTGIQVHGPKQQNFVWPGRAYSVTRGERLDLSIS
jgi:hypothetical protein